MREKIPGRVSAIKTTKAQVMKNSELAATLVKQLAKRKAKIVFAESCTGGLASGELTKIPGVSAHHCGGMVVYREETKQQYLGISAKLLKEKGAVSAEVAQSMALNVLQKTPEATIAAAVTGHLGPNAPEELDGVVYLASALRGQGKAKPNCTVIKLQLSSNSKRPRRQQLAIKALFELVLESLS